MRIAVVFDTLYEGWESSEHERQMAKEVAAWHDDEPEMEYQIADALRERGHEVCLLGVRDDLHYLTHALGEIAPDLVFNCAEAFHRNPALEYLVAGMLEAEGYRYTGSPPLSLLVSRNKAMSKKVLAYHGIRVPGFATYRPGEPFRVPKRLRFPLIVKPLQSDASTGIAHASVVQDPAALADRVTLVHERFHQPAIAEEFIEGRELYVSLIGNGDALDVLPLTEMVFDKGKTRPEERIATQYAKWDEDYRARRGIRNVFARPLARSVRERIDAICRTAFRVLWLRDYARLDVRLAPDDEVWFLEANANPFISYGHDMANAAEKAGLDYYAFIERLVDEAVERYERA
ncbi:MAG: ATP-grasp domain-containing protein [Gemmatimonadales bacterium]|nr:ATP-grasp domain-containing protein [Gemmatimonadales bacterium]